MKPLKLTALIGILSLALWAPAASASLISFDTTHTFTVRLKTTPYTPYSSSATISGTAQFPAEAVVPTTATGTPIITNTPAGGTWLNTLEASYKNISGTDSLYQHLVGTGPGDPAITYGNIAESASITLYWTLTQSGNNNFSFSDSWTVNHSLDNSSGQGLIYANWTSTPYLYMSTDGGLNYVQIAGGTPLLSDTQGSLTSPSYLASMPNTTNVGTFLYERKGGNKLPLGTYNFKFVLDSQQNAVTATHLPIPPSVLLLSTGLLGLGLFGIKRWRKKV
jgi:hypothetical protein